MKMKSVLLISLIALSVLIVPTARAQKDTVTGTDDMSSADAQQLTKGIGQIFGLFRQFGASGETLGRVMQLMFENFANMSATQQMPGVYVLNASLTPEPKTEVKQLGNNQSHYYDLWRPARYNLKSSGNATYANEYPYLRAQENGTANVTTTEGASVTFVIWDSDGTLIDALDRIILAFSNLKAIEKSADVANDQAAQKAAIQELISAAMYFVIHINDIITGDEVIVLNIIGYTRYDLQLTGYGADFKWFHTVNGRRTDQKLMDQTWPAWKANYTATANKLNDNYAKWLLNEASQSKQNLSFTDFSFDVVELWLKNFEVHIDVEALMSLLTAAQDINNGGTPTEDPLQGTAIEDVFRGLDIEFYIFTHSFVDFVMFDDSLLNNTDYSASVQAKAFNGVPDVVRDSDVNNTVNASVDAIAGTEVTHYFNFRGSDFAFDEPVYDTDAQEMQWGFHATGLEFRLIPLGLKPEQVNYTTAPIIKMESMSLGFSFAPNASQIVNTAGYVDGSAAETTSMGCAKVKLLSSFGKWNQTVASNLDLATIFISTILHVHLHIDNEDASEEEVQAAADTGVLMNASDYNEEEHMIKVGNFAGDMPLADIDIAGPNYEQTTGTTTTSHPAKTNIIPTVYGSMNAQAQQTYVDSNNGTNVATSVLTVEMSVLLYAVAYPTFKGSGDAIVHDPTFSIFITFNNPGVLAILLVVGAVALVGIAAVMITKKKNAA